MPGQSTAGASAVHDFRWDLVVFKVEDRLFRVNKHAFVQYSSVLKDMYLVGDSSTGEGTSDDRPIILEGYSASDFEALLMILYPSPHDLISGSFALTKEQWIGVLRLCRAWEMQEIRKFAMQTLSSEAFSLTPVEKANLGHDHKVSSWLVDGLTALTLGEMQLSPDALEEAVGLRTAFRISNVQVQLRSPVMINTVVAGGEKRTGISLSALYCAYCVKPFIKDQISCKSCSAVLERIAPGTGYISGTISSVMVEKAIGSCFYFNVSCIYCVACSGQMIAAAFPCHSCSRFTSLGENVYACHDPLTLAHRPASTSTQALIREVFQDEIRECDL